MATRQEARIATLAGGAALALLTRQPAGAADFDIGGWSGTADTAVVAGAMVRTDAPATSLFAPSNGDLNFKQGDLVSQADRITEELHLERDETTVLIRGTALYDPVLSTGSNTDFRPLSRGSIDESGHAFHLLDAFVDQKFDLLGHASSLRIGNQVINLGESTFIQGGINSTAPFDVTASHAPGVELKDIILPVPAVDFKTSFGVNYSVEGYYQFLNAHDRLDGAGTFFGNDTAGNGGFPAVVAANSPIFPFGSVDSVDPSKSARNFAKEFGVALRTTVPSLSGAEFGLYVENYASRIPFLQLRTGTAAAAEADELGLLPGFKPASYFATTGLSFTYPENIHLVGTSFNVTGPLGLAIQGEVSSRLNQPLSLAVNDSFLAVDVPALCDRNGILFKLNIAAVVNGCSAALVDPVVQAEGIRAGSFNQDFQTYERFPVTQAQFTLTKLYSDIPDTPVQTIILVAEAGGDHISGFPKDPLLLSGAGTQSAAQANDNAYGYVLFGSFDMPHVLPASIDMTPTISFSHDVQGTSPGGAGSFTAHAAAIAVGINFNYLQNLTFGLSYVTNFNIGGNPALNAGIDQDFVQAFIGYQF